MSYRRSVATWLLIISTWFIAVSCWAEPQLDEDKLKNFLEGNDYWNVRLSPDGRHISALTHRDERNTLIVLDLETLEPTASVKYEENKKIEITHAEWINPELLYYTISRDLARLEQDTMSPDLFVLSANGKRNYRLWSFRGNYENNSNRRGDLIRGWPSVVSLLPDQKHKILLFVASFERRDGAGRSLLVELDQRSGDFKILERLPEYTQTVVASKDGRTLLAHTLSPEYEEKNLVSKNGGDWEPFSLDLDGFTEEFEPLEVVGDFVYVRAQRMGAIDSDTHILRYQISDKSWDDVFNIGFSALRDLDVNEQGELVWLQWVNDLPRMRTFDEKDPISRVLLAFAKSYPGFAISPVSLTDDKKKLLVHISSGAYGGEYFLYDKETRKARFLVSMNEDINGAELAELKSAGFTASDGVKIPGWFQAPAGVEKPPLVVYIHGGPHGPFNPYRFDTNWHLLNAMGYAVYAPNFRGSGGFGPRFEGAGFGKWGTRMIDDIAEGAKYLVSQGLVDGSRICAYGASYGGYATAQSLVRHNDLYRCGVIIAGVFDMTTQITRTDTQNWYAGDDYLAKAIGSDKNALRQISPIYHLDKITAPMLILHGKEDERTPFKGAEDFVDALKKDGKTFEYHWYPKEGHGNAKLENRIDEWRRIENFLTRESRAE
ncbi:MAG: prolyl oligopeptidase family serine peptidase [Xanthomonadales bacterium]|nr:prolyl oligopeptidase family serine peptidase [Xanthomonadales bacterium]